MKKYMQAMIDKKTALILMFIILGCVMVWHTLIITEQIPYGKVWAGRLESVEEMRSFETFSIILNVFMLVILVIKYKLHLKEKKNRVIDIFIWVFVIFFSLNTVGNLFAKSIQELLLGTLFTLISAILCYKIVKR